MSVRKTHATVCVFWEEEEEEEGGWVGGERERRRRGEHIDGRSKVIGSQSLAHRIGLTSRLRRPLEEKARTCTTMLQLHGSRGNRIAKRGGDKSLFRSFRPIPVKWRREICRFLFREIAKEDNCVFELSNHYSSQVVLGR